MNFWTDPIKVIYDWLMITLTGWGMAGWLADIIINLLGIIVLITAAMVLDILLVWVERKVVARFQDRLGPNRVGPFGLFQPVPDIIKLIIKEDITPAGADKVVFNLAPILSLASVIFLWAVIPLAANVYGVDLNVALLYLVAAGAIGTLAIIMAGWASNNKYALLGAYRMVAVMISYEIPMIVALLIPTLLAGTMSMKGITLAQQEGLWFVVLSPLGMLLFLVAAIAELGRSPFDLSEGESEIVSGFHIEYSGMKFGLFYAGELLHAFTFGAFIGILFFGGWNWPLPWGDKYALIGIFNVLVKGMFFYWVIMWVKYTVPRLRIDHMLAFNWKFLTPVAFALLIVTAIVHAIFKDMALGVYGLALFLANVLLGWIVLEILRGNARQQRAAEEAPAPVAQH
ncbi:MAG: NADH-quinone oxidoreductase subunit NuoH [Anaerolineae bacterium]|nr:MAG: NADH-quinone oxidoreductase subunit NuoH [Anaerolineae bacterium]